MLLLARPVLQEYCPSGHRCSNQMFTKREFSKLEVVSCWGSLGWRQAGSVRSAVLA